MRTGILILFVDMPKAARISLDIKKGKKKNSKGDGKEVQSKIEGKYTNICYMNDWLSDFPKIHNLENFIK